MDLGSQFLFFFSVIGVFNGILLSLYCLGLNRRHIVSRYLFGGLLLATCLRNAKSVMVYFGQSAEYPWLLVLGQSACLMTGPLLYSFIRNNNRQEKQWGNWMLYLLGTGLILVIVGLLAYPVDTYYDFWRNGSRNLVHSTLTFFIILSTWELRSYFYDIKNLEKYQKWTLLVLGMNVLVGLGYITALLSKEYTLGPLVFSISIYILLGVFIYNYNIADHLFSQSERSVAKMDDQAAQSLLHRLSVLMKEGQMYKRHDIRIQDVAKELGIPKHHLSQLLNKNLGIRFSNYINEYRINAACDLLRTESKYTLEGIGHEVGFKSKSTFFTTFKQKKAMTPSAYQKKKNL